MLWGKGLRDLADARAWWSIGKREGTFDLWNQNQRFEEEGALTQALLPLIPDGATQLNDRISVVRGNDGWRS